METYELRKICNQLLRELKEVTQNRNVIKLSVDIQLPDKFREYPSLLKKTIATITMYLSKLLINGAIHIEINHKGINENLVVMHVVVTGLGSSRVDKTTDVEMKDLLGVIALKIEHKSSDELVSFEFVYSLEVADYTLNTQLPFYRKKILVAEDNEINAMVFSSFLEEWGIETVTAVNGQEAISQARETTLDGILMDVHMPVLDGNLATKIIREFNSAIPIIALTASTHEDDFREAISCGANDCLLKPISSTNLFQVLSKYL